MFPEKLKSTFYRLQHQEFLKLNQILTHSELSVYLWLKTKNPFGGKLIEADTRKISEDLGISRRTVQRALPRLQQENFIELEISNFKYRLKSKSANDGKDNFDIKDDLQLATPESSDDSEIAMTTPATLQRHQDRYDDTSDASTTSVSPSSAETKSSKGLQSPKIFKTYIDFKDSLSESERENYLKFVKEAIKDFGQPIHDLEAWLASQTKAGQNRWEVYYQKYQRDNKASKPGSDSSSVENDARKKAIANYQKQLNQEKNGHEKTDHETSASKFNQLLDNPEYQIKRIDKLKSQSKLISKPLGKYVSDSYEHLRNLRMASLFSNESIQGGMA